MISFIIVGKNEGWKITKCVQSVLDAVRACNINKYEVIYVDSKSTDDSIERVKKMTPVKTVLITGECNSAVARNVGVIESSGDNLFFIDGDMEIKSEFLEKIYNEKEGIKNEFVSGNWINMEYNEKWELQSESVAKNIIADEIREYTTGGIFLIKRKLWNEVNGMKTKLKRSQDLDLGLRLAKRGHLLTRVKDIIAIHHTIPYNDKKRMWSMFFSGAYFYRVVLLRDNFLNVFQWKLFFRGNYTFFFLFVCIIFSILLNFPYILLLYFSVTGIRIFLRKEKSLGSFMSNMLLVFSYEFLLLFAFFFFWPSNKKICYKVLQ